MPESPHCTVCHKALPCPWVCAVCRGAGITVALCSSRCKRVHLRDGRHRREVRMQRKLS